MSRKAITREVYDRMIQAFRDDAPKYRHHTAAKGAGVHPDTMKKAWVHGWPRKHWPPIQETVREEQVKARALLIAEQAAKKEERDQQLEDAQAQATASKVQEGKIVSIARGSSLQCLAAAAMMVSQSRALAEIIKVRIDAAVKLDSTDPMALTANGALAMLDKMASVLSKIVTFSHQAMVMERLHLGQPGEITGVAELGEMTLNEADTRIEAARQAIAKAHAAGGFQVIDGGIEEPVIGKRVVLV